ncbi:claudin-19-like [Centroberyx gerrardi]|uniref:claudin-19-like n=1 Tax=Centroberyx gerrardi TaxID=166262 RepID=UPI003AAD5EDC
MASSGLQLLGFMLALVGLAATIAATYMVEWRVSYDITEDQYRTSKGLWMTCSGRSGGIVTCQLYESLLKLPIEIQATRAVMLVGIFLSSVALVVSTVGMKCTRFMDGKEQSKSTVVLAAGVMFIISGLLTLAITSWYVRVIVESFFGSNNLRRYEFGSAVFVSWAGAIFTLAGGVFLSCRRCSKSGSSMSQHNLHTSPNHGSNYV